MTQIENISGNIIGEQSGDEILFDTQQSRYVLLRGEQGAMLSPAAGGFGQYQIGEWFDLPDGDGAEIRATCVPVA